MKLSTRLLHCANYATGFNKLADIGTDHALLPMYAVTEGLVSKAQAIDNKKGPYETAVSNVQKQGLENKVEVILGDGLSKLDSDVDVVVISGMGGGLIAKILTENPRKNVERFILQPNNNSQAIRKILPEINCKIVDEIVFLDGHEIYEIVVIEKGFQKLSNLEQLFGPINLREKPYYFVKMLTLELDKLHRILEQISDPMQRLPIKAKIQLIEEALR